MRAFTLIELLIVLIIVGILAGIAIPNYAKTSERAKDREAQAALSLIQAAERIYRLRNSAYYGPTAVLNDINNNLKLSLSAQVWNYTIFSSGPTDFEARATRVASVSWPRFFWINAANANATCSGTCP